MCLAIPGKVVKIDEDVATVDYEAEKRQANISLIKCQVGDFVLVSGGFVVQIIPKKDAKEALEVIRSSENEC